MKKFNIYRVNTDGTLDPCGSHRSALSRKDALMLMLSGACYSFTCTRKYFKDSKNGKRYMVFSRDVDNALFIAVEVSK